jgi:hypothetical protein
MRRVLLFFPKNLYPPHSGFHRRGLEMLKALRSAGCKVTLASTELCTFSPRSSVFEQYACLTPTETMRLGAVPEGSSGTIRGPSCLESIAAQRSLKSMGASPSDGLCLPTLGKNESRQLP